MQNLLSIVKCGVNLLETGGIAKDTHRRKVYYAVSGRRHSIALKHLAISNGGVARRPYVPPKLPKKQGWLYNYLASMLRSRWSLADKRNLTFVHWGYSWVFRLGFDPAMDGFNNLYLENDLVGFGATQGKGIVGYLCDSQAPYYEGRRATDLENMLNSYQSGDWQKSTDEAAFVSAFTKSDQHKYMKYDGISELKLDARDVLVMGQVGTDASWYSTDCSVADNIDLVSKAVQDFPDARSIYFKAHPRWSRIKEDRKEIERRHPNVVHVDPSINFKTLIRMRPRVVVNTSGTGLDAGLLGCEVHSYGYSFYAGWGATIDHHPSESIRRSNRLSFEDIFVVTTLHYSRHFHRDTMADATVRELVDALTEK